MESILRLVFGPVFSFFVGVSSHADILFIGLNPAEGEVKTVRQVAEGRGEKFFYWPQIEKSKLAPIKKLDEEEAAIIEDFSHEMTEEEETRKTDRMLEIQNERQALRDQLNVNIATFKSFMIGLEHQNVSLSAVVISGHDGNGKFWGQFADTMNSEDFAQAFALAPKASSSLRTVALLGCYTTSVGALDAYWKKAFPNGQIFGGYDEKGPNSEIASGHRYLEGFLSQAQKLAVAKSQEEFWKLFRNLPKVRLLAASVVSNQFFANNSGVQSLERLYESCKELRFESQLRKSFTCYYRADNGCEDVPKDTGHGAVRLFYEELQEHAHCRGFLTLEEDHSLPKGELVLNLIFFENMRDNFFRLYQKNLLELDEWLRVLGVPSLNLATQRRSRAELFKDIRKARVAVDSVGAAVRQNQASKEFFLKKFKAATRLSEIDDTLLQLSPKCAPSEWVDPMQTKTSACVRSSQDLNEKVEKQWAAWRNKGR